MRRFRYVFILICALATMSCGDYGLIQLSRHYIEVDSSAQNIVVNADNKIIIVGISHSESDLLDGFDVDHSNWKTCSGGWFTATIDEQNDRRLLISIDENDTDKDRTFKLYAERTQSSDTLRVIQSKKVVLN